MYRKGAKAMKLCLNTHNLAGNKTLDEIIGLCVKNGIGGIEFSIGYGHNHGSLHIVLSS